MRLVLTYINSDGITYSEEIILCIEYDSEESLLLDFESALISALEESRWEFTFLKEDFLVRNFFSHEVYNEKLSTIGKKNTSIKEMIYLPNITPLDKWFEERRLIK